MRREPCPSNAIPEIVENYLWVTMTGGRIKRTVAAVVIKLSADFNVRSLGANMAKQVLSLNCGRIFPNNQSETAAEHAKACSIQSNARQGVELEIGLGIKSNSGKETPRRGSAGRRGRRIKSLWAKDSQHVIQHSEGYERSDLFDLNYPERSAEVKGKESVRNVIPIKQRSPYDSPRSCNSVPEPFRTAMVKQLVEALKVHNNFLEAASDAVLELLPEEKDEVRECLQKMARMLRIEMGSEDAFSPSFGRKTHQEKRSSFSAPAIAVVPAASTPGANDALPVGGGTLLTPRVVDTQSSSELDPSSPAPNTLNIRPEYILSRSASPARQPLPPHEAFSDNNTAPDPAPSSSQAQQPTTTTIPSLKRTASNSVTLTTEEGEPLQETHISQEDQYAYFTQMMNCCQEAVYDWFIKNRDVLLENCECKMLVAASAENSAQVPGVQEGNAAPSCNGKTLTKQQKRRLKRMAAAAAAASSEAAGNDSGTQSSTAEGGPATPAAETAAPQQPRLPSVCLLHTVTGPTTLTLPRWTHHLRRLVEQNRIPPHIIANKDSFSGEIQPVDEVRHAVHKRKLMSDRDLLALVQQARKFCWQLKDWDRCRTLDELYEILENAIKLVKEEEGWTDVVGGSMRGRRRGRVVSGGGAERRVVVGSSRQGNTVGGEGEEGVWG
ncbi:hypothetical protein BDZ91DRAFT_762635 [Kalaharituber pfeilii]|nr:hypothetical protein BDZ91DRAFT_762635 [Kalaharituber pfeilii]